MDDFERHLMLLQLADCDESPEYMPDKTYGSIFKKTLEMTDHLPTISERHLADRQGILAEQARILGTFSQLRTCPYNESHRVSEGRYHNHIASCRRDNPEKAATVLICEHDGSHHIPQEVYGEHLTVCWSHNEQTAQNIKKLKFKVPDTEAVKCWIRFYDEDDSECTSTVSITKYQKGMSKPTDHKFAKFTGPTMKKSSKYTCWI